MSDGHRNDGQALVAAIPQEWRDPALLIANRLAAAGHRAWIVGGCVRDLLLERPLKDVDLVSAALPDEVEALFEHTLAVGKAFGIVVVVLEGREIEVATFRRERGYSDRRRPDEIEFADSPEIDAERRDFTCNALFLDPLDGTLVDPTGGAEDLERGVLRAVGDAGGRFREDGLRILRMARFLAALGFEPAPGLLDSAREESASLDGVSPERVLDELGQILRLPRASVAIDVLARGGHLARCVPGWNEDGEASSLRASVVEALGTDAAPRVPRRLFMGLAALLEAAPLSKLTDDERSRRTEERITALRASRDLRRAVLGLVRVRHQLVADADRGETGDEQTAEQCGAIVAAWRAPERADGMLLARAWASATGDEAQLARLETWEAAARILHTAAPKDPLRLTADDLMAAGVPRGPELGTALRRLEHGALGGAFKDRDGALAWLLR